MRLNRRQEEEGKRHDIGAERTLLPPFPLLPLDRSE